MSLAPIVLFVYNRLKHTQRTVEALQKNTLAQQSDLFVFSDGWKTDAGAEGVRVVRDYLKQITGFQSIQIVEREKNFGLAASVIDGVTTIVNQFGKVIVLEDDLVTSPYFLTYMNDALEMYKDDERVISIHGYIYPVKEKLPETFFIRGADCWGWATWKRGWDHFEPDGNKLLNELKAKKLTKVFDLDGSYPYTDMLTCQTMGLNSSWAIRWYASAFLKNKLTLYPGESFVLNVGFDNSGTHTGAINLFNVSLIDHPLSIQKILVEENIFVLQAIRKFFMSPKLFLFVKYLQIKNKIIFIKKNLSL